jgi:hypothetical protein
MKYVSWVCLAGMIFFGLWVFRDLWRFSTAERRQKRAKRVSTTRLMELLARNREIEQPMKKVCCYCQEFLSGDPRAELVSYGICSSCRDIHFSPLRLKKELMDHAGNIEHRNTQTNR